METLGVWLRQTREAQGATLKEAEGATRIRVRFLEMLEIGDFAAFPGGEVQVRGFLRIYARYLGLSPDEVVARYEAEVRGVEPAAADVSVGTRPAPPARSVTRPAAPQLGDVPVPVSLPRRLNLTTLMVVAGVFIILLAAVAVVGYLMSRDTGEQVAATIAATAPSAAASPLTATVAPAQLALTPTFPVSTQGVVTLTLEATEHVWVRVTRDSQMAFQGLMAPGQVESWSTQQLVIVETGNGGGLLVTVNGQSQGTMCDRAQICTRAWGPIGEVAVQPPTPTPAP
jgi:cytoskeleton protein RodZ